jgi:hypothetical protein
LKRRLKREFGEFKYAVKYYLADANKDIPEIWQKWWTNQMVGNYDDDDSDDGPWNSPEKVPVPFKRCQNHLSKMTNTLAGS